MELKLFYYIECPFCRRVVNFIEENEINVEYADTLRNDNYRKELIKIGGKSQVPCLLIDGKPLYESNDIIQWLKENLI